MTKFFEVGDRVRVVWADDQDVEAGIMAGDMATVESVDGDSAPLQVKFDYGLQRFMLRRQMEVVK